MTPNLTRRAALCGIASMPVLGATAAPLAVPILLIDPERAVTAWNDFCSIVAEIAQPDADTRLQVFGGYRYDRAPSFQLISMRTVLEQVHPKMEQLMPVERRVASWHWNSQGWQVEGVQS